ncbi:peptidoglycan DD-metalloendopeptidase family protein [Flavobacterium sp. J49]|uniref:peptidoglycan DD-metalloendopeptidase family protein n=1 Tax=Flavobacterium sp. J49 TaxID=2718534 RepID=UPI00159469CA|nr:peptidoglycan DD-metalloendopeptidase family protein [Flavobacterium sp. J49]MBF6640635.1 peptidoglycan DD-metalloendopeptidase family protein [Flavobacterium sp. J49]NIC01882.1 peptidoglycan DD-metalloendopeptidase family protein [Flavobacterium sp. J49]
MKDLLEILRQTESAKVISNDIAYADYVSLDLSVTNENLAAEKLATAKDYENYIQNYLENHQAQIAFGGYNEIRNLYQRSTVFKNNNTDERNIHIGLDLWINESAPIYAALEGKIHSFQNNDALGDYGPTIILEHEIEGFTFHTLYGHLSLDSLTGKKVGDFVKKGEQIATLGLPPINGDYAPHLHFQIIIDMENKKGDYPGVCNSKTLAFYLRNCPDPNLLLKIKS